LEELYIVDGYNFIFNYYNPEDIDTEKLTSFRDRLVSDLIQYKNYTGYNIIVVFDAKKSPRKIRSSEKIDRLEVIYSKGGETADSVVEKLVHSNEKYERIFVVTSDYMQQKVVFKKNIYRKSIREFAVELKNFKNELSREIKQLKKNAEKSFYSIERRIGKKTRKRLDDIRKKSIDR
jgi:predicted RNA-binding protein with PIN domain